MIICRVKPSKNEHSLIAHGAPVLAQTQQGRAYFKIPGALARYGRELEISVDITELESMLTAARASRGRP